MNRIIAYLALLLYAVTLPSCTSSNLFMEQDGNRDIPAATLDSIFYNNPDYQYHIRVDDKISISVWQQDELSVGSVYGIYNSNEVYGKWLLVDAKGNIEAPRIGTIRVQNKSAIALKDTLTAIFSEWLVNPVVDIKVMNKSITILGEVNNPQVITIDTEQTRLLDIIAMANGFDFHANIGQIKVLRQVGEHVHIANIDLTQADSYLKRNIQIYPGDVVIVPAKNSKQFDRILTNIIPFTSLATTIAILFNTF